MTVWQVNWYSIFAYALGVSFVLSAVLTHIVRKLAIRWNVLDHPGERKMQSEPVPLLGGVAIALTFFLVIVGNMLILLPAQRLDWDWLQANVLSFLGTEQDAVWKLAGVFLGGIVIVAVGVIDDLYALRPEKKLVGQILSALLLVLCGVRFDFLNDVIGVHPIISGAVTMVWIVMMTNALNFLDNMDGLCAGVSAIAGLAFFACVLPTHQTFVCVLLMVFVGSVSGFLYHNFSPARIFMGDAGAMFCGYILATVAVLGTFYSANVTPSRIALAAPLLALSVPVFDTVSVVYIRWRRGESIMKGDKRHFSHRLVEVGMTPRQAVEFIYLVGLVTGLGAALLPHVDFTGTIIVLAQAVGVYLLIVLLMNSGNGKKRAP
ncbi:MAG: undecaprenyl/decaprenyl-phosphate alpha-N-acetylglucosaminyl 1-phosphate transferase [Candidatus Hydrogenedentes bacterium]|nr:undecaprenyl/decaprenyl-phosphate alpha-N-acetylglucosaminyl 1-phosphate transferase [Candidatus Hydrogenedentota bacterium]